MSRLPDLRISILGPPSFSYANEDLIIGRLQNRAFLYRLAAQNDPVPRESMAFLFWPDMPDARAQRNLTMLLSQVRRELPDRELIVSTKEHLQLNPSRVWSDARELELLCAQIDPKHSTQLTNAAALYRDTLLVGLSFPKHPEFESWLLAERSYFEKLVLDSLTALVSFSIAEKKYDEAIPYARRYLAIDDLAEGMHRYLMECYDAVGDRSAALQQYERCVSILDQELGVLPLPETEALYHAILVRDAMPTVSDKPVPVWTTLPGPSVPLVGRQALLGDLTEMFRQVWLGRGQAALLLGEAGIGKSRFIQEFLTAVQSQALVLAATCHRSTQSIPYLPLVEALQPIINDAKELARVPDIWLAHAAVLFPELERRSPSVSSLSQTESEQAKQMLFQSLRVLTLQLASSTRPIILCFDDLHWADLATIEWLTYLTRYLHSSRLLLLTSCRSEQMHVVDDFRAELRRLGLNAEKHLPPLQAEDVEKILFHANMKSANGLAAKLWDATGGNPFFLLETVQELREARESAISDTPDFLPISINVRDTVRRRLSHLQPVSRQIADAGAVCGVKFSFDLVRQTSGRTDMEAVEGLDELVDRHLLIAEDDEFHFNHELTRMVVYADLSSWRLRILHKRVAETLERQVYNKDGMQRFVLAAQIGHHYAEGGELVSAVSYFLAAGDFARGLYEHKTALSHYERALQLALVSETDASVLMKIHMGIGDAYMMTTELNLAIEQWRQALSLLLGPRGEIAVEEEPQRGTLSKLGKPDLRAAVHLICRIGQAEEWKSQYSEALRWLQMGRETLGDVREFEDVVLAATLHIRLGSVQFNLGDLAAADQECQLGLALIVGHDAQVIQAEAQNLRGIIFDTQGQAALAIAQYKEALETWRILGNEYQIARVRDNIGTALTYRGEWLSAQENLEQGYDFWERTGNDYNLAFACLNLGTLALYQGRYDVAGQRFEQALELWTTAQNQRWIALCYTNLGLLYVAQAEWSAAEDKLNHSLDLLTRAAIRDMLPEVYYGLSEVALGRQNSSEARACAQRSLSLAVEVDLKWEQSLAYRALGQADMLDRDFNSAQAAFEKSLDLLRDLGIPYDIGRTQIHFARLYHLQSQQELARTAYDEAVTIFEKLGAKADLQSAQQLAL